MRREDCVEMGDVRGEKFRGDDVGCGMRRGGRGRGRESERGGHCGG